MSDKQRYEVSLVGCDDTTRFDMELTEEEAELLRVVARKSEEESSSQCMPTMTVMKKEAKCQKI